MKVTNFSFKNPKFLVYIKLILLNFSPVETEVWNVENGTVDVIEPTLSYGHYAYGIALYSVDSNFCANN